MLGATGGTERVLAELRTESCSEPGSKASVPRWRDLRVRAVSAAILAPLALACVWVGGGAYLAMVAGAAIGLAVEWVHLCGLRVGRAPGLFVPAAILGVGLIAVVAGPLAAIGALALGCVLTACVAGAMPLAPGLTKRAPVSLAAGVAYVGAAAVALIWLRGSAIQGSSSGRSGVLFVLLVVWTTDMAAYGAGRLLGGPRLAPSISPSKTWAGAVGGLLAASAAGMLAGWFGRDPGQGALIGFGVVAACLSAVAQAGDLLESHIKRRFGVKDTGRIIPGHGGLLDRLDGVLAAAPVAALLALTLGSGVMQWQ